MRMKIDHKKAGRIDRDVRVVFAEHCGTNGVYPTMQPLEFDHREFPSLATD
jgi:hypothetical protein